MTPHDHATIVPGCYRCDLGMDEVRDQMRTDAAAEAIHQKLCGCSRDHAVAHDDELYYDAAWSAIAAVEEFDRAAKQ